MWKDNYSRIKLVQKAEEGYKMLDGLYENNG